MTLKKNFFALKSIGFLLSNNFCAQYFETLTSILITQPTWLNQVGLSDYLNTCQNFIANLATNFETNCHSFISKLELFKKVIRLNLLVLNI